MPILFTYPLVLPPAGNQVILNLVIPFEQENTDTAEDNSLERLDSAPPMCKVGLSTASSGLGKPFLDEDGSQQGTPRATQPPAAVQMV